MVGELVALLTSETLPVAAPAVVDAKTTLKLAVCPAAKVSGAVRPLALKPLPETLICEMLTGVGEGNGLRRAVASHRDIPETQAGGAGRKKESRGDAGATQRDGRGGIGGIADQQETPGDTTGTGRGEGHVEARPLPRAQG